MAIEILPADTILECLKAQADALGGQGIQLFTNAVNKTQSKLLDFYIRPHLLKPGHSYIYIAEDNGKTVRPNYDPANTAAATLNSGLALPGQWGLFANPLQWVNIDADGLRPSERPINIGFCVYTIEFDNLSLREQLKAIWGGGLRRTDEILASFKDYRGFEAVYGGAQEPAFPFCLRSTSLESRSRVCFE